MESKPTVKEKTYKLKSPSKLLESDLRFTIYCLLHVYPEISLSDLAQKLNNLAYIIYSF
ncbi:MAG: hypothetical protein ACFE96_18175 [Candidatus Hermodarchaeota archaeon]